MRNTIVGIVALVVLATAASALFTVGQTEQVLITQFGQPIRVITEPGLHVKIPFIQTIISFDRRLLDYSTPSEEVILSDQRRLIVDSFTRFHITDPLQYFQAVGAQEDAIRARLNSVVTSALRRVLGNESLLAVLSTDRGHIMGLIRDQVNREMNGFGVSIEDVRIRRADLPEGNTQAILNRMKSERQRVASQARAEGAEASAKIRADAERHRSAGGCPGHGGQAARPGRSDRHRHHRSRLRPGSAILHDLAHPAGVSGRVGRQPVPDGRVVRQRLLPASEGGAGCSCAVGQFPLPSQLREPHHLHPCLTAGCVSIIVRL